MSVFEVAIGPDRAPGCFRVDVLRSPAGEASAVVRLDAEALGARRGELQQAVLASAVLGRKVLPVTERCMREVGLALFGALLGAGDVAGRYRASAALAAERGEALRVVLRIGDPGLAGLPWEAMYDQGSGGYVCRRDQLVRNVAVASAPAPLAVNLPLRVLGVVSSPRGLSALDVGREQELLADALSRLAGAGLAELVWAPSATWADVQDMLLGGQWHVLHFIGHGDFDPDRDEGVLALVAQDGRADLVEASRLVDLLRQARPMPRLVVLNSCSGAATGATDLFSGTAAALVRGGVSAVAAMQYEISDPAAVAFARGFYGAIARGRGVDDAVSSGRVAIIGLSGQTLEWVTPVLYLRGNDSRLFTMPTAEAPSGQVGRRVDDRRDQPGILPSEPAKNQAGPVSRAQAQVPSALVRTLTGHPGWVRGVAFSPDGRLLASAGEDRTVRLWDVATGAVSTLTDYTGPVLCVAFSPDGHLLAAGADQAVWLRDMATGAVHTLTGHTGNVYGVAFDPRGHLLASAGEDQTVRLWDVATGAVRRLTGHTRPVFSVAFSPDRRLLASAGTNREIWLWDETTGDARTLTGRTACPLFVAFSPDGRLLAYAGNGKAVLLWEVATGVAARAMTITSPISEVSCVAFSPDGSLLAGGSDRAVCLWDVATGAVARTLTGHTDSVRCLAFSPDGSLLASAGNDRTVRLWG